MTKFQFPASIASRPLWGTLVAREGTEHLMIADAEGAEALLDLATPDLMCKADIIYVTRGTTGYAERLKTLNPLRFYSGSSYDATKPRIENRLCTARSGLQLYLAGTESLMGQVIRDAQAAGLPHDAIQTEHRGSVARRMQCVHCKGITEDVETDPFVCSHCGLHLFVRDHYSRRHAAFQGVRVDAEDHGNIPKARGIYA